MTSELGSNSFYLDDEHEELRSAIRRFAEKEIAPNAKEADETETYPRASFEAYRDSGFVKLQFPTEFGGDGGGALASAILVEEMARVCASTSLFVLISKLGMIPVLLWGSEELKARFVPRVASGESQASYCLSEQGAGSDVAAMTTRAVRDGENYILNGSKTWITNAGVSDLYTVFAVTDPSAGHRGLSAFVVEGNSPGFAIGSLEHKMGMRGSPTGELIFNDVVIPEANRIGEEGRGFHYAMATLDRSRPTVGAQAVGIAQGALEAAAAYVTERRQFDQRIVDFQGIQFMLADMATSIEASRLLVYRACSLIDSDGPGVTLASAMAKCFASDTAMKVTTDAVQLLGGAGYTREFPLERMMRDAKVTQIYEGTNQVQRVVIARRMLEALASKS